MSLSLLNNKKETHFCFHDKCCTINDGVFSALSIFHKQDRYRSLYMLNEYGKIYIIYNIFCLMTCNFFLTND